MNQIVHLAKYHYLQLTKRKGFLLTVLIFLFLALNLIPNKAADYLTFYIGDFSGNANDAWVGSVGAVLSNMVLLTVGFFFLDGTYQNQIRSGFGTLIRSSRISNFKILLYQWMAYLFLLLSFLALLIITLYIVNIKQLYQSGFSWITFIKPFVLFSLPLVFIISSILVLIDTSIKSRTWRVFAFFILIGFIHTISHPVLGQFADITGVSELSGAVKQQLMQDNLIAADADFSIGYISKSARDIQYFDWSSSNWTANIFPKLLLILLLIGVLFLRSFTFGRFRNKSIFKPLLQKSAIPQEKIINILQRKWNGINRISPKTQLSTLFMGEWKLLSKYFSPIVLVLILTLWGLAFFASQAISQNLIIPAVMLLIIPLYSNFFDCSTKNNLGNFLGTSVYTDQQQIIVKIALF